jgi:magnesium transporter
MVTIYAYNIAKGTLERPMLQELPKIFDSEGIDLWIDFENPTPEETEILFTVFNFHELAIEDCIAKLIEEAKLDNYEDYLFIVLYAVNFVEQLLTFNTIQLNIFFGKNYVVTYHQKPTFGIDTLRKRLEKDIGFMAQGADVIFHTIIDSLVDNYFLSLKHIEKIIYNLEIEILSNPTQSAFNNLCSLKRDLINFRRIFAPSEEVLKTLGDINHPLIREENQVYFQDIHDHISSVQGLLNSYMEMVTVTLDTYLSLTIHQMNTNMQKLTVIATILLLPTLIASVYGMNLRLPGQNHPYGFAIVMFCSFMLILGLLLYFKKKDWF